MEVQKLSLPFTRKASTTTAVALSIIIVNWNTRDLLAQCLESVANNARLMPHLRMETFVVDNASTDSSAAMVGERFPWVQLVENEVNTGFAQANNQAIRLSTGRYVLLLNPDTEVKPQALYTLMDFMESQQDAGAAGSWLLNADGSLQTSCYPAPTLSRELWRLFHLDTLYPYSHYQMDKWDRCVPQKVDVLKGACVILRRKALDEIGLLDENYFMYSEEVDLCYRLQKAGWNLYWVPQSQVVHFGGESTKQVAAEMFLQLYRGKVVYFRKHYGRPRGIAYKLILLAASLARLSLTPVVYLQRPPERDKNLLLAVHYSRLLAVLPRM